VYLGTTCDEGIDRIFRKKCVDDWNQSINVVVLLDLIDKSVNQLLVVLIGQNQKFAGGCPLLMKLKNSELASALCAEQEMSLPAFDHLFKHDVDQRPDAVAQTVGHSWQQVMQGYATDNDPVHAQSFELPQRFYERLQQQIVEAGE
jgi:hypothetical protein